MLSCGLLCYNENENVWCIAITPAFPLPDPWNTGKIFRWSPSNGLPFPVVVTFLLLAPFRTPLAVSNKWPQPAISQKGSWPAKPSEFCTGGRCLYEKVSTFIADVEVLSSLGIGHEVIDAGEVVGVEIVLELVGFNGVVELREVVLGDDAIEDLQIFQIGYFFLCRILPLCQPFLHDGCRTLQSLQWVLNIYDQLLCLLCLQSSCISNVLPKNSIS